jgi:hypothetical protein
MKEIQINIKVSSEIWELRFATEEIEFGKKCEKCHSPRIVILSAAEDCRSRILIIF